MLFTPITNHGISDEKATLSTISFFQCNDWYVQEQKLERLSLPEPCIYTLVQQLTIQLPSGTLLIQPRHFPFLLQIGMGPYSLCPSVRAISDRDRTLHLLNDHMCIRIIYYLSA